MSTATPNKTPRTIIAASTSNGAGSTTRGTLDLRTAFGGLLTLKLTNGGTGPTVGATINVLVAHNSGATLTAGSAGTDWKTIFSIQHSTTASAVGEWSMSVPQEAMHLEVEVTGNTGQAVTCEAFLSEMTSISNV